ncbi:MAG: 4Fe-4S dicluster domain-containing protein [Bdellovibrionaceae bacterium]|jgi:ferredoxin-type protein NapG|nr:4Fe-4S dicluster domain-containing protein [Pseudobdellovibrionaceae bacterium]
MSEKKTKTTGLPRRAFLKGSSYGILAGATLLSAAGAFTLKNKKPLLRPPGALKESTFLASCIKCGQCLQVCPPQVIELAGLDQGFGIGTPYITPSKGACILCSGLPCVLSCPTGALDHHISEGKEAHMGLAVISSPNTCLSIKGESDIPTRISRIENTQGHEKEIQLGYLLDSSLKKLDGQQKTLWLEKFKLSEFNKDSHLVISKTTLHQSQLWIWVKEFLLTSSLSKEACTICLSECPIKDEAPIVFKSKEASNTAAIPIIQKSCVGCGMCEMLCPTEKTSITIIPQAKWKES